MRFLLLCPVALLLLTAPAQTIPTDSVEDLSNDSTTTEPASSELIDSSPSPAKTTTSAPEVESGSSSTELPGKSTSDKPDQPDPKEIKRLSRELAEAFSELNALRDEAKILEATILTAHSKVSHLVDKRLDLAWETLVITLKLQEAQDNLNTESPEEGQCKPSESELAKLIDEETSRQLEERNAEVEHVYENQYQNLLEELRQKIEKQMQLVSDHPKIRL